MAFFAAPLVPLPPLPKRLERRVCFLLLAVRAAVGGHPGCRGQRRSERAPAAHEQARSRRGVFFVAASASASARRGLFLLVLACFCCSSAEEGRTVVVVVVGDRLGAPGPRRDRRSNAEAEVVVVGVESSCNEVLVSSVFGESRARFENAERQKLLPFSLTE